MKAYLVFAHFSPDKDSGLRLGVYRLDATSKGVCERIPVTAIILIWRVQVEDTARSSAFRRVETA